MEGSRGREDSGGACDDAASEVDRPPLAPPEPFQRLPLHLVTGAPGAGKSAVEAALLESPGETLIFDADWLLGPASALAGKDVTEASATWPAYRLVWLRIVQMLARNGRAAALFSPATPAELAEVLPLPRVGDVRWCLLDCADAVRVARLQARGWPVAMIEEALADARALRGVIPTVVDTSQTTAREAAALVRAWLEAGSGGG